MWGHIINRIKNEPHIRFLEYKGSETNSVRGPLDIPPSSIILGNRKVILERYSQPKIDIGSEPTVFHSSYYRLVYDANVRNITTVHDFTYEYFVRGTRKFVHTWQKYRALRNSEIIVCVSENTKKDLLKFLPEVKHKRIEIIHNGVGEEYLPIESNDVKNGILYVGGRQSYKNFSFAIDCAKNVSKKLIIAGAPLNENELKEITFKLGNNFTNIIFPSNQELNLLYNSVEYLLYPSSYEGFGIPILEAQRAGCPVIAINNSSIREVSGGYALLMESADISEFKKKNKMLSHNLIKEQIIAAGLENAKRFSWDKMSNQYLDLYNSIR